MSKSTTIVGEHLREILALLNQMAAELYAGVDPEERVLTLKKFHVLLKLADGEITRELLPESLLDVESKFRPN